MAKTLWAAGLLALGLIAGGIGRYLLTPEKVRTETETVTELSAPAVCLEAISEARRMGDLAARFATISSENSFIAARGVRAAASGDYFTLSQLTDELEENTDAVNNLTARMNDLTFRENAEACEESG